MKYSVYDIIYRNDSNIKKMLESDLLFTETGFVAFSDGDGNYWYLYKKEGILVPGQQDDINRTYGMRDALSRNRKIRIGTDLCDCSLPSEECAKDFFSGLGRIGECADLGIVSQLWKIESTSSVLYDAPIRMIRPEQFLDSVSTLKCAYVKDRATNRRNFTNFDGWEYIDSYEMDADGTLFLPQEISEEEEAEEEASSQESAPDAAKAASDGATGASQAGKEAGGSAVQETESGEALGQKSAPEAAPEQAAGTEEEPQKAADEPSLQGTGTAQEPAPDTVLKQAAGTEEEPQEAANEPSSQGAVSGAGEVQESISDTVLGQAPGQDKEELQEALLNELFGQGTVSETTSAQAAEPEGTLTREPASGEIPAQAAEPEGTSAGESAPETSETPPRTERPSVNLRDLLDCDRRRCRLESYEENMLYDIKRGHWDLCGYGENVEIPGKGRLVARDPRKDIRTGIVGIDFGTKSTVVVHQDDTSAIIPIRIGAGDLSAELKENDYENPTIIECTDLDEFMRKYFEQEGRPETSCDDFFVSYDAYTDYRSCAPNEFYAYYADLKQWANHEKENIVIWDKQKQEYQFGPFSVKDDRIINPIELYAYYIGMYINNMRNGIYMKYLMSFPVGYPKRTRQLIVASFEQGIRKSLPQCILDDENCMKEFSVRLGISEPAAYAVTALEMSDLEPEDENDRYRYGIFDFGGGTADFGFGIWRGASEDEYEVEGYDYVLECFGADSDVTLGGEKILELLAYAVFKKNRGVARRKRITCSLPYGEQAFLGSETLISNSQIAQRNMSILKEELRPLWHQEENWEQKYRHESGGSGLGADLEYEEYIEPALYDIDGNKLSDCRFAVDTKGLITLIKARIQKGIDAFFKCMGKAFQKENRTGNYNGPMYIFLAGNSSKSIFVKELFEEAIREHSSGSGESGFKLVEPLNGENGDEYVPNGKTSVAYGLIKSREGSSIKVEKNFETDAEEQTRFKYYLGRERRHHFDCRLSPAETDYGTWIRFQGAARQAVRIYYTTDPTADVREEPPVIDNIPYKEIAIEPRKDAFIFIKPCEPSAIEYTVATPDEMVSGENEVNRIYF
ncbi:MAG: hypothetical protein NC305_11800 [Lachnospiraceae bacterium]|nr:hypothetical protein [Butyrivibrio sp.]MCM1344653.1 hypothetical protein [Muribaculaceae bacterium]MCM1411215.1 hypothetical protein [Lachnospiraceae bacterium]